jgi:hypothetical protein
MSKRYRARHGKATEVGTAAGPPAAHSPTGHAPVGPSPDEPPAEQAARELADDAPAGSDLEAAASGHSRDGAPS